MKNVGLEVLCQGEGPVSADIVFVHGLRGDRRGTWTKDQVFWPQDLLPHDLPACRILSYGYDADVCKFFGPVGESSIYALSLQLLEDIQNKRRTVQERKRPIVFVAHSLGGLIVKDALNLSYTYGNGTNKPRLAAIKTATVGIVFAGTPHRGSDKAVWVRVATNLAAAVLKDHSDKVVGALSTGSETLERLQEGASNYMTEIPVFSFYEEKPFPKIGMIVDRHSASLGFPRERQQIISANHVEMVKYESAEDIGYERMLGAIRELVEDATPAAPSEARAATKTQYQFAVTLQEYRTQVPNSLAFGKDTVVEDVVCSHGPFWSGRIRGMRGIFPHEHVRVLEDRAAIAYGWHSTTELYQAALIESHSMMLHLFHEDPGYTPYVDDKGQLDEDALYFAVDREHEDIVLFLSKLKNFDFGAAIARPFHNQTPLQLAFDRYLEVDGPKYYDLYHPSKFPPRIIETVLKEIGTTQHLPKEFKTTSRSWTPLLAAAAACDETIVELLTARNDVEADCKDEKGRTPLSWAAGRPGTYRDLSEKDRRELEKKSEGIVRLLLDRDDVNVNSTDDRGTSPLMYAASSGREEIVKRFLERQDVDLDLGKTSGRSALAEAARGGRIEVVRLLLTRKEVEADSKNEKGWTPLMQAGFSGYATVVQLLADRDDVDADSKDNNGETPLSLAASAGYATVVQLLADRDDVDADSKDNNGQTALSWAATNGHLDIVTLLADRSDVVTDSEDNDGQTPLMWAAENGRQDVVKFLCSRSDVNIDSTRGFSVSPFAKAATNFNFRSAFNIGRAIVRNL